MEYTAAFRKRMVERMMGPRSVRRRTSSTANDGRSRKSSRRLWCRALGIGHAAIAAGVPDRERVISAVSRCHAWRSAGGRVAARRG